MSAKNFSSYGDLETILTGYANSIKSKANFTDLGMAFDKQYSYNVDEYVTYNNNIYRCIKQKPANVDFSSEYFETEGPITFILHNYFPQTNRFEFVADEADILNWVSNGFTGGASKRVTIVEIRDVFSIGEGTCILGANDDCNVQGVAWTANGIYHIVFDSAASSLNSEPADPESYIAAHCTINPVGGSGGGGTKYYKHVITFRLKTPAEYYNDQPDSDYWDGTPGPNGRYITGMYRMTPNSDWVKMTNEQTPGMSFAYNSDLSEHRINFTLAFISPIGSALNSYNSAKSAFVTGKLIHLPLSPNTDTYSGNMSSASFNGSGLVLHRDNYMVGDRTLLSSRDGEKYYYLRQWMIADWTDTVTEWTA